MSAMFQSRILTTTFLLLLVASALTREPLLRVLYAAAALAVALSDVRVYTRLNLWERAAALLLVMSLTLLLPVSVLRSATALVHYLAVVTSLACAFVLTRNRGSYLIAS